jgi:excisionase family DNA binding protein
MDSQALARRLDDMASQLTTLAVELRAIKHVAELPLSSAPTPRSYSLREGSSRNGSRAKGKIQADVTRNAWSVREFAATLGVSYHTVLRAVHRGELASTRFPAGVGEYRIPNSELTRLLAEANERG